MVGQSLVKHCKNIGYEILTVDRNELDLRDSYGVTKYFEAHRPDLVIAAAAKVGGIHANSSQKIDFLFDNLAIQNSLIMGAVRSNIENFVFLGSSCIYPKNAPQPMKEESLLTGPLESTNEAYAVAKMAGVKLCEYVREENGFNYFSLMPTNLFGPGDNYDLLNSHVPAALMRKFHVAKMSNLPSVKVWGTGNPLREFMHVDDLADAVWFTIQNPPNVNLINVGYGLEISISDFAHKMANVVGYEGEIEFDSSMPDGAPRKLLDSSKLSRMGWSPKISLGEGLESTYTWFTKNIELGMVRGYVR
jgi:GDP-L-fucose synthase